MKDWIPIIGALFLGLVCFSYLIPSFLLARDERRERKEKAAREKAVVSDAQHAETK